MQWEFEVLIRELILNAPLQGGEVLDSWQEIRKLINTIKKVENDVARVAERQQGDVLYELVRIAHRQFPWQAGFSLSYIARYHWLYSQPGLFEAISSDYEMTPTELFQIGFSLVGSFMGKPHIVCPMRNQINEVSQEVLDKFLNRLSMTVPEARERFRGHSQYNVNWAYSFNPLRKWPLIKIDHSRLFCPVPSFLVRRLTSEIYFDLIQDQDEFSRSFGPAVQAMIGYVANYVNQGGNFKILEERRFGSKKKPKDSVDWIISDQSGHIFVECKGARIRFRGTSDLTERTYIVGEFERIKGFAVQAYKALSLALDGEYPHWTDDGAPKYVMIVTLEDWQSFGLHVDEHIIRPLCEELAAIGIDPDLVKRHPFTFCPIDDFEAALQVARQIGIRTLLERKHEGEYPQWSMRTFLASQFSEELRNCDAAAFESEWALLGRQCTID